MTPTFPSLTRMARLPRSTGAMVHFIRGHGQATMPGTDPLGLPMALPSGPVSSKLACSDWAWWMIIICLFRTNGDPYRRCSEVMGLFIQAGSFPGIFSFYYGP